jgi:hypothetical protein
VHVRGHCDDNGNDRADALAQWGKEGGPDARGYEGGGEGESRLRGDGTEVELLLHFIACNQKAPTSTRHAVFALTRTRLASYTSGQWTEHRYQERSTPPHPRVLFATRFHDFRARCPGASAPVALLHSFLCVFQSDFWHTFPQ